ncbi:MAG: serine--tRNA ligase, partial [Planctomycetaceae bacterium]|nr:serine--tRNA ligase [Planctomycetaceae bacterium]
MLDRKFIIQNADQVRENCQRRGVSCDIDQIVSLESERLEKLKLAEELNRQANETSKQIPKAENADQRNELIEKGRELRLQKETVQRERDQLEATIIDLQSAIPNMTHPDVPTGGEDDAKEISFGKTPKPDFDFDTLDHVELGTKHDLFDFEAGDRAAGAGVSYVKNAAVRLDRALQPHAIGCRADQRFTPLT